MTIVGFAWNEPMMVQQTSYDDASHRAAMSKSTSVERVTKQLGDVEVKRLGKPNQKEVTLRDIRPVATTSIQWPDI